MYRCDPRQGEHPICEHTRRHWMSECHKAESECQKSDEENKTLRAQLGAAEAALVESRADCARLREALIESLSASGACTGCPCDWTPDKESPMDREHDSPCQTKELLDGTLPASDWLAARERAHRKAALLAAADLLEKATFDQVSGGVPAWLRSLAGEGA